MILQALAFYLFAFMAVASGAMVIVARNPVHSVLFLILAFFNSAGLFVLMGAEFLAMLLVVVYVGAVAVLFLFVVMMLDIDFIRLREGFMRYLPIGAMIGLVLLVELAAVIGGHFLAPEYSGPVGAMPGAAVGGITNTEAIGRLIYTDYVYIFQAAGLVLLVAMVGAIVLTARRREGVKRQRAAEQTARRPEELDRDRQDSDGERRVMFFIGLGHYLTVAAILFTLGLLGIFLNRKNVIVILMSIELMLLAVNINLVAFSAHMGDLTGQIFAMFVLTVAAAEAAIGLAILVVYHRNRGSIEVEDINMMKG